MPTTIVEAAAQQRDIHIRLDRGEYPPEWQNDGWRYQSLNPDFELKLDRFDYSMTGRATVNKKTQEVCSWDGTWVKVDGVDVLLCKHCWQDGT